MSSDGRALRIAISGKSGCGNSTVSRIVAETLGLTLINYTFHTIAQERMVPFKEICRLAQEDPSYDLLVDRKQVEMARKTNCVLGSRLAIWVLREADLRVFLTAPVRERARRIAQREGTDFAATLRETMERDIRDRERYISFYRIDTDDYRFADLVINTALFDQHQVAGLIIEAAGCLR